MAWQKPKMVMSTSRNFLNWILYQHITLGHLKKILRNIWFCAKKATTLPHLTVLFWHQRCDCRISTRNTAFWTLHAQNCLEPPVEPLVGHRKPAKVLSELKTCILKHHLWPRRKNYNRLLRGAGIGYASTQALQVIFKGTRPWDTVLYIQIHIWTKMNSSSSKQVPLLVFKMLQ